MTYLCKVIPHHIYLGNVLQQTLWRTNFQKGSQTGCSFLCVTKITIKIEQYFFFFIFNKCLVPNWPILIWKKFEFFYNNNNNNNKVYFKQKQVVKDRHFRKQNEHFCRCFPQAALHNPTGNTNFILGAWVTSY